MHTDKGKRANNYSYTRGTFSGLVWIGFLVMFHINLEYPRADSFPVKGHIILDKFKSTLPAYWIPGSTRSNSVYS